MVRKEQYPNGRTGRSIAATRRILEKRPQSDRELLKGLIRALVRSAVEEER